jgi:hypothetical protein
MIEMGTYAELLLSSPSFNRLLDNIHQQEYERPIDIQREYRPRGVTFSEGENEEEQLLTSETLEMKETGGVNWNVYIEYLQAGAGLALGLILLILIFTVREVASVFYSWWLAGWNEDESHRHHQFNNCTGSESKKMNIIRSMSDVEWNNHRNRKFYFFSGM